MSSLKKELTSYKINPDSFFSFLQDNWYILDEKTPTQKGTDIGMHTSHYYGNTFLTLTNKKSLQELIKMFEENTLQPVPHLPKIDIPQENTTESIRTKFPAQYRTEDWHFVRSKAEKIIDDYLYHNKLVHTYEKKLPTEEELFTDFYIPLGDTVYIEYWWYENNPQYLRRKEKKIEIYKKYNFNLIELNDKDIESLDDVLPKKLLAYGITLY